MENHNLGEDAVETEELRLGDYGFAKGRVGESIIELTEVVNGCIIDVSQTAVPSDGDRERLRMVSEVTDVDQVKLREG